MPVLRRPILWLVGIVALAVLVMCTAQTDNTTPAPSQPSAPVHEPTGQPLPTPGPTTAAPAKPKPKPARTTAAAVSYRSCAEARAAGAAPLHRGDPGWNSDLDRDGDGVACE